MVKLRALSLVEFGAVSVSKVNSRQRVESVFKFGDVNELSFRVVDLD